MKSIITVTFEDDNSLTEFLSIVQETLISNPNIKKIKKIKVNINLEKNK